MKRDTDTIALIDYTFGKLPDHLLTEIFIRVPVTDWAQIACVRKHWAIVFRGECLWRSALIRTWPAAGQGKGWPGPIPRGLSRRRYAALYISKYMFAYDGEIGEIIGHTYLFLKEQLEHATMPPPSGVLHGTIIDQFIACGKSRDKAHELASQIWVAVIDNMDENERTFILLKHLVQERNVFLPHPYSRSYKVEWRVFEKLLTDFRDCFSRVEYYDVLASAKYKFQHIPSSWLGSRLSSTPSPRSASKKLASTLRSLSFKKRGEPAQDDDELLQQDDPCQDLETAYVAHISLTWEALHCQYMLLSQKISSEPESPTCYNHVAQQFQQFQVLLQRFIENEPFEQGPRVENYARSRQSFSKLLQVPSIKDSEKKGFVDEEPDSPILASDLIKIMESMILTFLVFIKMDKKKQGTVLNLFGGHNQIASPLQQTQSSLEKKEIRLKELLKKKKGWKKKSWPVTMEEVELLFGLIDIKVISRTLRMARISKDQLLWCEEKLSKLELSENKFKRDGTPIMFPSQSLESFPSGV